MRGANLIKVGVVLHPLTVSDFLDKFLIFYSPFSHIVRPLILQIPPYWIKWFYSRVSSHKIFETNIIKIGCKKIQIIAVMCPVFPEQLVLNKEMAVNKIIESVKLLLKSGTNIVTLAGFSSIVTDGGYDVIKALGCCVTSGNSLTAAMTIEGIKKVIDLKKKTLQQMRLAVIGATGDIGSICSIVFARDVKSLVLCSRGIEQDIDLQNKISVIRKLETFFVTDQNLAIKDADIVVVATSAFGYVINPDNLKSGAIVCDVSMPPNVSRDEKKQRQDVLIFQGGRAKVDFFDQIHNKVWEKLFPRNSIYGCLAEGIALALDGQFRSFSIGKRQITEDRLNEISLIAKRNGIGFSEELIEGV